MLNLLAIDFINSQWYNTHEDMFEPLRDENWLAMMFKLWNIPAAFDLTEARSSELIELREWLYSLIGDLSNNSRLQDEDMQKINRHLTKSLVKFNLKHYNGKYYLAESAVKSDWNWVINSIILSFTKLLIEYDASRIRICDNPECGIVFYDRSKSRTKKFCHSSCANIVKVRRYRAKQNSSISGK